jgi:hypothetical protein
MVAGGDEGREARYRASSRKVRAPQGRMVGNAHRPQGQGQRNRKQTATPRKGRGKGETAG